MPGASTEPVKTCLLVDDDPAIRKVLARLVQSAGFSVQEASDGIEALQLLRQTPFTLLIVDFRMPRLGGPGLIRMLRSQQHGPQIIAMSGGASPDEILEAFDHQVVGFLQKPFRPRELQDLLATLPGGGSSAGRLSASAVATQAPSPSPARQASKSPAPRRAGAAPQPPRHFAGLLKSLDTESIELPVPDPVVSELIRLQTQPEISGARVRAIVESSPSIARRLMQAANSAYYRSQEKVKDLQQAIVRIGNRAVLSLALTLLHRRFYDRGQATLARSEWDHTVFAAIVARELSRRLGRTRLLMEPEEVYLVALFHNIGNAVLLRLATEQMKGAFSAEALSSLRMISVSHHERLGARILRTWKLPPLVADVASAHHKTPTANARIRSIQTRNMVVHLLSLATQLVDKEGFVSPVGALSGIDRDTSLNALGLRAVDLKLVMERSRVLRAN